MSRVCQTMFGAEPVWKKTRRRGCYARKSAFPWIRSPQMSSSSRTGYFVKVIRCDQVPKHPMAGNPSNAMDGGIPEHQPGSNVEGVRLSRVASRVLNATEPCSHLNMRLVNLDWFGQPTYSCIINEPVTQRRIFSPESIASIAHGEQTT